MRARLNSMSLYPANSTCDVEGGGHHEDGAFAIEGHTDRSAEVPVWNANPDKDRGPLFRKAGPSKRCLASRTTVTSYLAPSRRNDQVTRTIPDSDNLRPSFRRGPNAPKAPGRGRQSSTPPVGTKVPALSGRYSSTTRSALRAQSPPRRCGEGRRRPRAPPAKSRYRSGAFGRSSRTPRADPWATRLSN